MVWVFIAASDWAHIASDANDYNGNNFSSYSSCVYLFSAVIKESIIYKAQIIWYNTIIITIII